MRLRLMSSAVVLASMLLGCGGGGGGDGESPSPVKIGGKVSGLEGTGLVLQNNGADPVTVSENGTFTFPTAIEQGASYEVTVRTPAAARIPTGLIDCAITGGSGTAGAEDVTDVQVDCRTTALFIASDDDHGQELWKTDGTAEGTSLLKDLLPGRGSSSPAYLKAVNGRIYFQASGEAGGIEPWVSDGTADGTFRVKDINPSGDSIPAEFQPCGEFVCFLASLDGTNRDRLWRTDGTEGGTQELRGSIDAVLGNLGGAVLFSVHDDGRELWASDGTPEGTKLVTDLDVAESSDLTGIGAVGGVLYFAGDPGTGLVLWKSDGTAAGTAPVEASGGKAFSNPYFVGSEGGAVYFAARVDAQFGLWRTGGTSEGIELVRSVAPTDFLARVEVLAGNPYLWVNSNDAPVFALWKLDGTPEGTELADELGWPGDVTPLGGALYFTNWSAGTSSPTLWKTDGTVDGTVLVSDRITVALAVVNGALLFGGYDDGLWATDGTSEGTVQIADSEFDGFEQPEY